LGYKFGFVMERVEHPNVIGDRRSTNQIGVVISLRASSDNAPDSERWLQRT
jgi:hypothetical protein